MKQKIFVLLLAFFVISCLFTFKINTIDAEVINNDQSGSCTIQSLRNCDRDGLIRILIELLLNFIENNQQPGSVPVEPIDEQENKQEDETSGDSSFIDSRDGQGYSIVKIGNQTWMGENLRYLPSVSGPGSGSKYSPFYYVNGYTGTNVLEAKKTYNYNEYGVLYNYSAALTACPSGWHLPSDQEWYELEKHLSSGSCQYNRYGEWDCAPAGSILKESKFRALMAASRDPNGNFYNLGANTSFWSSSRYLSDALYRKININENRIYRDPASLDYGFSVRCIKGYSNQDPIKVPSINIISPKPTDTLIAGKTYTVKWESRNLTGNIIQVFELDGRAVSYLPITATSYDWTIPSDYANDKASISIDSVASNGKYEASGTVAVNVTKETSTPYINIIFPNPTDTLIAGKTYTIKWESRNLTGNTIQLVTSGPNGGGVATYLPITATSYNWTVPIDYANNKASISIDSVGSNVNEAYEAYDTVVVNVIKDASPYINIIFPNPTDTLIAGETYTIKWESSNLTGDWILVYADINLVAGASTSENQVLWTIPESYAGKTPKIYVKSSAKAGSVEAVDSVEVPIKAKESLPDLGIKDVNYYADYYIAVEYCNYGKEQLKVAPEIKATNTKTGQTRIYATSAPKPGECLGAHNTGFQVSSIGLIYGEDAQVRVEIDPDNKIKEGNEDNNILVKSIRANESPYIERINPSQGRPGEKVTIYGKYLFGYRPSGITIEWFRDGVSVGNTISPITGSSDGRSLEFTLSNILFGNMGPGKYQIRVINDIGPSNLLDFSAIE